MPSSPPPPPPPPHLYIVTNPHAGSLRATHILNHSVEPLVAQHAHRLPHITRFTTQSQHDGHRIGQEIRSLAHGQATAVNLLLVGGDGTTNEVLNGYYADHLNHAAHAAPTAPPTPPPQLNLIIVPAGSANALYAACFPPEQPQHGGDDDDDEWRTRSLRAFLSSLAGEGSSTSPSPSSPRLAPLTLLLNTTTSAHTADTAAESERTLTHLVTSHALHAGILHDSETPAMRRDYPGIERFKRAFELNATRWTHGRLSLLADPTTAGEVLRYSAADHAFQPVPPQRREVVGPFVYLTALVTDRLEPHFVPAPFSSTLSTAFSTSHPSTLGREAEMQRPASAVDVVVIRPLRDPQVSGGGGGDGEDDEAARAAGFTSRWLGEITRRMYDGGTHVDLLYPAAAEGEGEGGEAKEVVEYYRAGGYRFEPDANDQRAQLTCLDGATRFSKHTEVRVYTLSGEGEEGAGAGAGDGKGASVFVWT